MKKILLFICMVMCAVGAKAQTYSTSVIYSYDGATGYSNYAKTFVGLYTVLSKVDTDAQMIDSYVSGMDITSVKVDGTERLSDLTKNYNAYRNYYGSCGVDIYFFNTSKGNVSFGSSQTSLNVFKNATVSSNTSSNNYQYGFTIGYSRAQARTYVIEGNIVFYYKGTQSYTRTFKITISPNSAYTNAMKIGGSMSNTSTLTALSSGSYTSSSNSSGTRTLKISSATDLNGNSIDVSNASVSSTSTGTGTSYTYSSSGNHVFYFKASRSGKFTVKVSQPGYSSYFPCEATLVITVNKTASSISTYSDNIESSLSSGSYIFYPIMHMTSLSGSKNTTYSIVSATNSYGVSSFVSGTDYGLSKNENNFDMFYAKKPGTYIFRITQTADDTYNASTKDITIIVNRQSDPLAFTSKSFDTKGGRKSFNLASAISTNPSTGAITYTCSDANVTISNGKLTVKKPGTYTINATQAQTDVYAATTSAKSFTITASPSKLKKVHSCMTNDYNMSAWYDGATANTWTNNTPNLRYVNASSMQSSETFMLGGLTELSGNHTVVKYSDAVETPITSTRMLIDANNKIVSTNPTFSDADKYDYVVPGNAEITFLTKPAGAKSTGSFMSATDAEPETQKVTFTRTEGLPTVGHYATICLPFDVPENCLPKGFSFEEHTNQSDHVNAAGTLFMVFTPVTSLRAGVPYIFKRTTEGAAFTITVPASKATFVAEPSYSDPHFYGTFINLVADDLHARTTKNPYNNGNTSVSLNELDTYFKMLHDSENSRVAYFMRASGSNDVIRKAADNDNVWARPFRAFFRLNTSDFTPTQSSGSAKPTDVVFIEHEGDDYATSVREFTPVNLSSLQLDVYDIHGRKVASDVDEEDPTDGLQPGIYILSNGKKVLKK